MRISDWSSDGCSSDLHRRARYEATQAWASAMRHKFAEIDASPSLGNYADLAIRRIQSRARNQAVNAMIQGSCATLAKQSILNLIPMLEAARSEEHTSELQSLMRTSYAVFCLNNTKKQAT